LMTPFSYGHTILICISWRECVVGNRLWVYPRLYRKPFQSCATVQVPGILTKRLLVTQLYIFLIIL
jgi:hypothetical protein